MSSKDSFSWRKLFGRKRDNKKGKARAKNSNADSLQEQEQGKDNDKGAGSGDVHAGELGLIPLNPHPIDGAAIEPARKLYNIDIVAVHGLGGDAYNTWTHDNGKLWLRDFVPDELPGARIFSYGYNSALLFSRETGTLRDYARSLLENIRLVRMSPGEDTRALIFVCHSMGGIVVKQALIIAKNESELYPNIRESVSAILFLGTPHQGSPTADYASILSQIANAFVIGTQASRFTGPIRTDLLKSLRANEKELLRIAEDFRVHTATIKITSFIEQKSMQGLNERIVDDISGFMGAAKERKVPMQNCDHREICKHGNKSDNGLKLLLAAIKDGVPQTTQREIVLTDKEVACQRALSDTVTDSRNDKAAVEERKGPRVEGTNEWILKHPCYDSWINSTRNDLLWLSGSPGIGKTMISCYLIDHLTGIEKQTDGMALVYFLCDDTNDKRNTALAIIRGLLLQLLRKRPYLFKHIMPEYEEKEASIFGDIYGLLRIFWCVVGDTDLRQVFLVIDALDECEEASRKSFLNSLRNHLNASWPGDRSEARRVKFLITSRPLPGDVDKELTTASQRIELSSALVNKDLQTYITQRVKDLKNCHFSPNQLERIEGDLLARSESTFLWVSIVLEEMKKLPPDEAEEVLSKTPNDLNKLYEKILCQIGSNSNFFNPVQLLLSWIVNAFRPLTVHQLATALLLSKSLNKKRNLDRLPTESDLQSIEATLSHCRTLVRVQDQDRTVHLLHQTLKEFLLTAEKMLTSQHAHYQILQTLVQNLCLDDMNDGDAIDSGVHSQTQPGSGKVGSKGISTNHLRNYSCCYWIDHARNCEALLEDFEWGDFFGVGSRKWSQCLKIYQHDMRDKDWGEWYYLTQCVDSMIVVASSQGILSFIRWCLKRSNLGTDEGSLLSAALCNAARKGHEAVVKLLLARDSVDPDSKDSRYGQTPLSWAAENGHEAVVKLLLARDSVDPDSKDSRYGLTPLSWAAESGHEAVVKLLLARDSVDPDSKDSRYGLTPLSWAARNGHEAVVKLLLARDSVDPDSKDSNAPSFPSGLVTRQEWLAPRGVNGSTPQASCYVSAKKRAEEIESNPWDLMFEAGEMFTRAENKAKACTDTMGEYGAYVNTPQTAADMNSILDAIGQEDMYYWGFSYGTTLGQTYAQMFPDRVSRLIIDGVSNLDEWYNAFLFEESLADTDNVYAGFVEECFKAREKCPLNSIKRTPFQSAADLQSHIDNFLLDLEEEPIPVYLNNSNYGAITRQSIVLNAIFPALYIPFPAWQALAENLAKLLTGNATSAFNAYSHSWASKIITDETNTFVILNDNWMTGSAAPVHSVKPIRNYSLSIPENSKLVSRYRGSDVYDRSSWSIATTHKFYPHYHPKYPRVKTANPILVLSTTFDPVCPLISAKKAHNSFEGAGFVEQKSYGHCSISMPSLCTVKHVRSYFNEGKLPEAGTTCDIDTEYFPGPEGSTSSRVEVLNHEDAELLAALQELAAADLISHHKLLKLA